MKRFICIVLTSLCLASQPSFAQSVPVSAEMDFISYLIGNGMSSDAVLYLDSKEFIESDTLFFLKGWANYSADNTSSAADYFSLVGPDSPYYTQSVFSLVLCRAYLGNYDCSALDLYEGPLQELKEYEIAGISLLAGDASGYKKASEAFTYSLPALSEGQKVFDGIFQAKFCAAHKSPALAAALSAVVPGLGKVYAGRPDEGIMSFISVGCCAAIAAENWIKCGPGNWKTILFTSLGAVFHIANIYGSYACVGIVNQRVENEQKAAVIYNLHIPIRAFYN